MNEIQYKNWEFLSDSAIEEEIGKYIKRTRQQLKKTQAAIAAEANISRSTLSLLERGESGSLKTLIQVLRVLKKLQQFHVFQYVEQKSPLALAEEQHKMIKRVRPSKKKSSSQKKSNW